MKQVAVLITVYNNPSGLEKTLKSLLPDHELVDIVVVDDGSVPAVDLSAFSSANLHLIRLPVNIGVEAAANEGLTYLFKQDYEFLARIDAGDIAINQRISKQLAFMRAHPEIGIVGSSINIVTTAGKRLFGTYHPVGDRAIRNAMCFNNILHHPTLMIRMDVMKKTGFYALRFFAAADYDLCWRMLDMTRAANLPERLLDYEWDNCQSISNTSRRIQKINALKVQLHHFDKRNPYAYLGIGRSLVQIVFFLPKSALRVENIFMRFFFARG